jgi:hypothetical protein
MRLTKQLAETFATIFREYVDMRLQPINDKLAALEQRGLDRGVWRAGADYLAGNEVSFDGALWRARVDTQSRPGSNADWRLTVKRGRK